MRKKTVPALLTELRDGKSTKIQANAARELGELVGFEILSALSDATKVRSPGVKTAANEAIEEIQRKFSLLVDQSVTSKKATEEDSSSNLEDIEDQILMFIAENNGISVPKLVQQFGIHKAKMEYHLDNLKERKFINFSLSMTSSPTSYFIDKMGRRYLVEKNLL